MRLNRIIGSCLVAITMSVAFATLRPMFSPSSVRAQSHYEYQLVKVEEGGSSPPAATLSKLTKQGWEPVGISFWNDSGRTAGFLLFRR